MAKNKGPVAAWYPDPFGRFEVRYWDGASWTAHVSTGGRATTDEPLEAPPAQPQAPPAQAPNPAPADVVPTVKRSRDKVRRDVAKAGAAGAVAPGGGTPLTEQLLVVSQKAKVLELNNEYAVFDQDGNQVGAVRQVGQSVAKKIFRAVSSYDQFMTHKLEIVDMTGAVLLKLTRPAKFVKSKVIVEDATGVEIGRIVQQNMMGKIRFSMEAGGQALGSINAENWRAWNFNIQDASGSEIARITKTWEGLAKTMFTTADNYVVKIHQPLQDPVRSIVVAAALGVDTALKQDSRGLA